MSVFWTKTRLCYGLFLAIQTAGYFLVGALSEKFSLSLWSARSAYDDIIPFLPWAIFPYALYFFQMAAPLLFPVREREMRRFLSGLIAASAIAFCASFFHSPLPSPRADLEGLHSPLVSLVRILYWADVNSMHFPSLHALHSLLIGMQFWRCGGRFRLLLLSALLISFSTVFVKQHFFYDTAAALIAAPLIFMIFSSRKKT